MKEFLFLDKTTCVTHNIKRHKCFKKERGDDMSLKGEKTKQGIKEKACQLFVEKGFKEVTMKDICELTGLSRGGLYRHYESTGQIFLEIVNSFSDRQRKEVLAKIHRHIPATTILEELLSKYASEMIDFETSLSLAINYGIGTKEFHPVNPESVFNVAIFAYQGVRMYSRLMKMDNEIPIQIMNEIKRLLLPEEVSYEK